MDVEFVIDETTHTIYIVQARPIVHNSKLPPPSYLADLDKIPATDKLIGQTIGAAGGAVRMIRNMHELIAKSSIGEALAVYQDPEATKDPATVVTVTVGKMAPATSHEATAFRSAAKPVICQMQWQKVEEWAKSGPLAVDTQQGAIVRATGELKTADGWIQYPVSRFISVNSDFVHGDRLTPEALQRLAGSADAYQELVEKIGAKKKVPLWKTLIKIIKTGSVEEATTALVELLLFIKKSIEQVSKDVLLDEDFTRRVSLLEQNLLFCAEQIKQVLGYMPGTKEYIKRLFPINFFEGLIYQQPAPSDVVDGYSVTTLVFKELGVEQKIIKQRRVRAGEGKGEEKVTAEYKGPLTTAAKTPRCTCTAYARTRGPIS